MNITNEFSPYVIGAATIEGFEREIEKKISRPLELFLLRLVHERPICLYFKRNDLCLRLLKLLPLTPLHFRKQAEILHFFRSRTGLPGALFENDVLLHGNESSVPFSKKLLEICFPWFKSEDQKRNAIIVPLGGKALIAFKSYLFTKEIKEKDLAVLQQLLEFSELINAMAFQKAILREVARVLSLAQEDKDFCFSFTEVQFRTFAACYFRSNNIITKIVGTRRHSITLSEFIKFSRTRII